MNPAQGTIVIYITDRGDSRAAIVATAQGGDILHVFLCPGDTLYTGAYPVQIVQSPVYDATGLTPNSYH